MEVDFIKRVIHVFYNDQLLAVLWHNIPIKLVPVSNNCTPGGFMCKDSKKKLHFTIIFLIMVRFLDKLVLVFLVFVENSVARLSLSDGSLLLPFTSKERTPVSHRLRASACAKWMIEPLEGVIDLMIDGHSGSGSGGECPPGMSK